MRNADIVGDNIQKKFEEGDYLSFFVDELKDEDLSDIDNYEDMEFYTKIVQGHWHLMSQEEE